MVDRHEDDPAEKPEESGRSGVFGVNIDRSGTGEVVQVYDGRVLIWTYARHIDPGPGSAPEPVVRALIGEIDKLKQVRAEQALTAEHIREVTNFTLVATFTEFARDEGYVSPELHEERERLAGEFGESNVLPSFYTDEQGVTQLGLFVRSIEV